MLIAHPSWLARFDVTADYGMGKRLRAAALASAALALSFCVGAPAATSVSEARGRQPTGQPQAASPAVPQVTGLRARHHSGQTFLTWREPFPLLADPDATVVQVSEARKALEQKQVVRYRIYRSDVALTS